MYVEVLMALATVLLLGWLHLYERGRCKLPTESLGRPANFPFRDADYSSANMPSFESFWPPSREQRDAFMVNGKLPEIPKLPTDERMI